MIGYPCLFHLRLSVDTGSLLALLDTDTKCVCVLWKWSPVVVCWRHFVQFSSYSVLKPINSGSAYDIQKPCTLYTSQHCMTIKPTRNLLFRYRNHTHHLQCSKSQTIKLTKPNSAIANSSPRLSSFKIDERVH